GHQRRDRRHGGAAAARHGARDRVGQEDQPADHRRGGLALVRRRLGDCLTRLRGGLPLPRCAGRADRRCRGPGALQQAVGEARLPGQGGRDRDGQGAARKELMSSVQMPRLSDSMETGKILRWLKKEGDQVVKGEPLVEIESDKANIEVEAYASGKLSKIMVAEGESAPIGAVIAEIGDGSAAAAEAKPPAPQGQAEAAGARVAQ